MLRPKIPTMPQPTGLTTPPAVIEPTIITPGTPVPSPTPVAPASSRPVVQLTPGTMFALVGVGTAAVLVLGAVLVSLLLAVAVTGASVAVCAVVLRSVLASDAKRR
ncbi:SpdD-like protein [Streptomyces phaeoluteigriseus]|uniref:SpdD-like protein n=1 Tax=Streptomyces phaeoluteigriseus TaxID=114686 RepID=A0A1V6MSX4_9ACTN|nr:SpdD-like protein [Streptomyces phaeoluteigriseus]OQD55373.1 SpdD-like protein [Streptomyces phaeoluteigriseus]